MEPFCIMLAISYEYVIFSKKNLNQLSSLSIIK